MGGELSGHILFKETGYTEAPSLVLWLLLQAWMSYWELTTSLQIPIESVNHEVLTEPPLQRHKLLLQNFEVTDKDEAIDWIVELFPNATQERLDGVRLESAQWDWRVLVRKSWTEPIIRLYVEARSQQQAQEIQDRCIASIKQREA